MRAANRRGDLQRQRLAYEAARIMAEQGVHDFERARRKAAARAGVADRRAWPRNDEIQEALRQHQRLFDTGGTRQAELSRLYRQALHAMRLFADLEPRLVGPLFRGTADLETGIRLHLFADGPEEVIFILIDRGIPWQECERILGHSGGRRLAHPAFRFVAGDIPVELVVLPVSALRHPPLDSVSERPEPGAGLAEVERLASGEARGPAE